MEKYRNHMIYFTDPIIDNKQFGIEYNDAEGNNRQTAESIYNALREVCSETTMYEHLYQYTSNVSDKSNDIVFSTRYGYASANSKALIPAYCEAHNIPYIGADSYTHMICNDKYLSKKYVEEFNLKTAPGVLIRNAFDLNQIKTIDLLQVPLVIKPNYGGGSNGISSASLQYSKEEAIKYIQKLQQYQNMPILVEEYIPGYEIEIIVFGDSNRILFMDEVQILIKGKDYFTNEIYDLETKKINDDLSEMIISNHLNNNDKLAIEHLFKSFDKVEFMRIDCRIYQNQAYVIELSPDCYLGKDGGVYLTFKKRNISFAEMFSLMIKNSLYPNKLLSI